MEPLRIYPINTGSESATQKPEIPLWRRYSLTIEEAAQYFHIGESKLRYIVDSHPTEDFYMMNGNRVLIKRKKFQRFLDDATAV